MSSKSAHERLVAKRVMCGREAVKVADVRADGDDDRVLDLWIQFAALIQQNRRLILRAIGRDSLIDAVQCHQT